MITRNGCWSCKLGDVVPVLEKTRMGRSFILGHVLFLRVVNRIRLCLETTRAVELVESIQFAGCLKA